MAEERFLVTGALGCIGAWTVKRLRNENVPVWTYDLPGNPHRLRLLMGDDAFFAGMQAHFAADKYGVTSGREFLATMLAHAGDKAADVAALYQAWIEGQ
jgi:nucleoside-diphosphate-sugar epimerase